MKLHVFIIILLKSFCFHSNCFASSTPLLRIKTGFSDLSVQAGDRVVGEKLQSMVTFQPSIVWNLPSFSSRMGFHFLSEVASSFGTTPLSGIGLSGYYYLFGISSAHNLSEDNVLIQKSKPGPYLLASLTPINFNLNKFNEVDSANNFFFNAFLNDFLAGLGYEYPWKSNMLFSAEIVFRTGASLESSNDSKVSYSGYSIFLTFATNYY